MSGEDGAFRIVAATPGDDARIDELVARSVNATFLHSRRFLGYHGDRFRDVSLRVEDKEGALLGYLPAAVDPGDRATVASHPGLSYGGLVHAGALKGEAMLEALAEIARHYRAQGFSTLRYKPVPRLYHFGPAEDDLYAMFRLGAVRDRCDLSSTIDFDGRPPLSSRRRRGLRKAAKAGIEVRDGRGDLEALWTVLADNLDRKHGVAPVHSLAEIAELVRLFPDEIRVRVATIGDTVVAGLVLFVTPRAVHAQYITSSELGADHAALDALLGAAIDEAERGGQRYFDFGNSNEDRGRRLNRGLFAFKSEFGAGASVQEFYTLDLSPF